MITHTPYSNLTTKELISLLQIKRGHSPIIEELCSRLEAKDFTPTNNYSECPVCDAKLYVDFDTPNDKFIVETRE